jgi:hypothetical protein
MCRRVEHIISHVPHEDVNAVVASVADADQVGCTGFTTADLWEHMMPHESECAWSVGYRYLAVVGVTYAFKKGERGHLMSRNSRQMRNPSRS